MANEQYDELELLDEITTCEAGVWDALVNGDQSADEAALDDGFLGVYSDGFAGKAEHVQQLANGATMQSYELSDLRVLRIGVDCALLSYRVDYLRKTQSTPEAMYVSSIWRRANGNWANIFSQDTPALD